MMRSWIELGREELGKPGTHAPGRQEADSRRYDAAMGGWFENFLNDWIDGT